MTNNLTLPSGVLKKKNFSQKKVSLIFEKYLQRISMDSKVVKLIPHYLWRTILLCLPTLRTLTPTPSCNLFQLLGGERLMRSTGEGGCCKLLVCWVRGSGTSGAWAGRRGGRNVEGEEEGIRCLGGKRWVGWGVNVGVFRIQICWKCAGFCFAKIK